MEKNTDEIELIDIEDIVPVSNANSLFLCVARTLIYLSHRNDRFVRALEECCSIKREHLRTDIYLQAVLRSKLCDFMLRTAVEHDPQTQLPRLVGEIGAFFQQNVYDFLIQLYQLSINNFSSNQLYVKFAVKYLSKFLNMRICLKKTSGIWKFYEPPEPSTPSIMMIRDHPNNYNNGADTYDYRMFKNELRICLSEHSIYLYEFKTTTKTITTTANSNILKRTKSTSTSAASSDSNNNTPASKIIRILLNKQLWLKNYHENSKICMRFSQFSDADELNIYNQHRYLIDYHKLINLYKNTCHFSLRMNPNYLASTLLINDFKKIFFAFLMSAPPDLLIHCEMNSFYTMQQQLALKSSSSPSPSTTTNATNKLDDEHYNELINELYLSPRFNTIGKQFQRFEESAVANKHHLDKEKLLLFLNHLWGKKVLNDEQVNKMYKNMLTEFNFVK